MTADEFGNYIAGFQGGAYNSEYKWTGVLNAEMVVKEAGIGYHLTGRTKAINDPWDHTAMPMINAGIAGAENFKNQSACGCSK